MGRERSRALLAALPHPLGEVSAPVLEQAAPCAEWPLVALARTPKGWAVMSPAGIDPAGDLVEGLSLADLVAEEFGVLPEPDRSARRSARGSSDVANGGGAPVDARIAALERKVEQLEHALAARVATERAIGVLAERQGASPRDAFEALRRSARSQGRPVAELAREVLESLPAEFLAVESVPSGVVVPNVSRGPVQPAASARAAGADGGS